MPVLQHSYLLFLWRPRGTAEWYKEGNKEKTFGHVDEGDGREDEIEDVMEEWDEEPLKGPGGTVAVTSLRSLNNGDWLTVVYDDH